jgi:hypothetical protein
VAAGGIPSVRPGPTFLRSAALLGAPVVLYYAALLALRGGEMSPAFVVANGLATLWLVAYPFFLWRYGVVQLPAFFARVADVADEGAGLDALRVRYQRAYVRGGVALAVPFALLGGVIYVRSLDVVAREGGGVHGASDPFFLVGMLLVAWGGVLVGFGMSLTVTTLAAVAKVAERPLRLHPFHHDTKSGLKPFGDFSLPATLLVASGALVLPLVFLYAPSLGDPYLLLGVACHTLAILATFVVPLVLVHRAGERARAAILARLQAEYDAQRGRLHDGAVDQLQLTRQLDAVRREQQEARDMRLYPFDTRVFVELTTSVLLPALVLVVAAVLHRLGVGA